MKVSNIFISILLIPSVNESNNTIIDDIQYGMDESSPEEKLGES